MKISVFAVGRMKAGPEKELADRYFDRFSKSGPAIGLEFSGLAETPESRAQSAAERKREEADRLKQHLAAGAALILLDERGDAVGKVFGGDVLAALVEQLYRSATILSGHPYHRA